MNQPSNFLESNLLLFVIAGDLEQAMETIDKMSAVELNSLDKQLEVCHYLLWSSFTKEQQNAILNGRLLPEDDPTVRGRVFNDPFDRTRTPWRVQWDRRILGCRFSSPIYATRLLNELLAETMTTQEAVTCGG